jgi:hypothetical protein
MVDKLSPVGTVLLSATESTDGLILMEAIKKAESIDKALWGGGIALIIQATTLIFFIGQFYQRQKTLDEEVSLMRSQFEVFNRTLYEVQTRQIDELRRVDRLEQAEFPQTRGRN